MEVDAIAIDCPDPGHQPHFGSRKTLLVEVLCHSGWELRSGAEIEIAAGRIRA